MNEYKLSPQFFSQIRRRAFTIGLPIAFLALAGGLWIGGQNSKSTTVILIMIVFLLILLTVSLILGIRQQQKLWSSYRIIVSETSIKRIQDGLAEVSIDFSEISQITESKGTGLIVQALKPPRQIGIPATLEDFSQLRINLAEIHPFNSVSQGRARWMRFAPVLTGIITIIAFFITFISPNPYISGVVGILLFGGLVTSLFVIQRNSKISKATKWKSCLIIFPLLAIAVRVLINILIIIGSFLDV